MNPLKLADFSIWKTLNNLKNRRDKIIFNLKVDNYSEGPISDTMQPANLGDLWVFGAVVKKQEIYIKIQLGLPSSNTVCISFHFAEFPMHYPFPI